MLIRPVVRRSVAGLRSSGILWSTPSRIIRFPGNSWAPVPVCWCCSDMGEWWLTETSMGKQIFMFYSRSALILKIERPMSFLFLDPLEVTHIFVLISNADLVIFPWKKKEQQINCCSCYNNFILFFFFL